MYSYKGRTTATFCCLHNLAQRVLELSELAGYTARVSLLFETMSDIRRGKFDKALVSTAEAEENAESEL